jgi:TP901 family phage tail tape measure protein
MAFEVWSIQGTMTLKGTAQVESQLKNMSQRVSDFGSKLQSAGRQMQTAGQQMSLFITAPLLAAAGASLKFAGDFDKAMRAVNVMLGASTKEVEQYKEEILALSSETAVSATDITSAFYQIVSAGFRGADAIDILRVAIKGAVGGAAEALTTTQALTKAMNIFALEGVGGASRAMDVFFGIVDTGLLTFEEMANSFPRAASNAAGLGVSIEETGAALGTLTKFTGSTEQAATALDATLRMLISPSEAMLALFGEWGVRTGPEAIEKFGGLTGVLKELQSVAQGDVTVIKALFQSDEALKGALPLLTYAFQDFNAAVQTVTGSTGRASEAFDEMAEGTGFALDQATTTLKNTFISLGDALATSLIPLIQELIDWVEDNKDSFIALATGLADTVIPWIQSLVGLVQGAIDWFIGLDDSVKNVFLTMGGIAVIAGPMLMYIGLITQGIGGMITMIGKFSGFIISTLIPALAKGIASFIAFFTSMGPAGWIILGGMAVALAAGLALFANWIGGMSTPKLGAGEGNISTNLFTGGGESETMTTAEYNRRLEEAHSKGELLNYQGGGPIPEDTLLYGLSSRRVYARAHEGEMVTSGGGQPISVTINMPGPYHIREEADIDKLAQRLDGRLRSTLRASGVPA